MKPTCYVWASLVFFTLGCQSLPTTTRTGEVKDIVIGDKLPSGEFVVRPGDEVRWVNGRTGPVRVVLLDATTDKQLSCKENFGGWMTSSDTAKLDPNEFASVCFKEPGSVRYTVRMKSTNRSGDINASGVVRVIGQAATGQAAPGGTIKEETRTTTTTTTITTPSSR
jgi:hypothetical protein